MEISPSVPAPKISVLLLTHNSSKTLGPCLESVRNLASEIILVDDRSTDPTLEIARKQGAKIFQRPLESFGAQKQFALEQASHDWVFLIDSDEQASAELCDEIRRTLSLPHPQNAYRLPRKNFYFGRWLKRGGKYPDFQTRLFRREACRFSSDIVHERVEGAGTVGTLSHPILHDSYPDMETWQKKLDLFSRFRAEQLLQKGVKNSTLNAFWFCGFRPWGRFLRKYVFKLGFLDGMEGLIACLHDLLTEILGYFLFIQKAYKKNKNVTS
ncbi:MAG: glycosyltransferase family 2 protein [Elusimicrobia bacterium]|nr:glycosyltransferase family 2 protein [Elusimicrobiota bacterium]